MPSATAQPVSQPGTSFGVLGKISASHMINDMMQSLIVAIYPILKSDFQLSFTQIGFITLTFQLTASLLQPMVGLLADRTSIDFVYHVIAYLPLLGVVAALLPTIERRPVA